MSLDSKELWLGITQRPPVQFTYILRDHPSQKHEGVFHVSSVLIPEHYFTFKVSHLLCNADASEAMWGYLVLQCLPIFSGTGKVSPTLGKDCRVFFLMAMQRAPWPTTPSSECRTSNSTSASWLVTSKLGKWGCGLSSLEICIKDIPY